MVSLGDYYDRLCRLLPWEPEPFSVIQTAEAYRQYWRPSQVKVLLLAESHVYTTAAENEMRVLFNPDRDSDFPERYVRLVYCLGYGESGILSHPLEKRKNTGTPQFWKIFYSCVNPIYSLEDFAPVQASKNRDDTQRLKSKLALLKQLKSSGVWLLDASPMALYNVPKPEQIPKVYAEIMRQSWESYTKPIIRETQPDCIICIGRSVWKILSQALKPMAANKVFCLPQPQARNLSSAEQFKVLQQYGTICSEYL